MGVRREEHVFLADSGSVYGSLKESDSAAGLGELEGGGSADGLCEVPGAEAW